jgi:hypothetical protein
MCGAPIPGKILKTPADWGAGDIAALYAGFDAPVTERDCGQMCAPDNPTGKPFCCDICQAVPAVYTSEWDFLRAHTDLWHAWRGDECASVADAAAERARLQAETPDGMLLLACLGPQRCQRNFRALSCRQFPFFPYVTADFRFLGLTYEWAFEQTCWVIRNLPLVTPIYREQFISTYDRLFALFDDEFENYALRSAEMRAAFTSRRRRIPVLHRNGGFYLLSPGSERLRRVSLA